jgi:hypothetical protein
MRDAGVVMAEGHDVPAAPRPLPIHHTPRHQRAASTVLMVTMVPMSECYTTRVTRLTGTQESGVGGADGQGWVVVSGGSGGTAPVARGTVGQ